MTKTTHTAPDDDGKNDPNEEVGDRSPHDEDSDEDGGRSPEDDSKRD